MLNLLFFVYVLLKNQAECRLWTFPWLELHVLRGYVIHRNAASVVARYILVHWLGGIRRNCWNHPVVTCCLRLDRLYFEVRKRSPLGDL